MPWTGEPGVTESVAEIMARQQRVQRSATAIAPHERLPRRKQDRTNLPQDPDAPRVARHGAGKPFAAGQGQSSANAAVLSPQTVGTSFIGAQTSDSPYVPPDTMGDVGPNQILICVNGRIRTFTRSGVADGALDADTDVFFASVSGGKGTSDPRVRYDRLTGRWFLTMITINTPDRVLIAVSNGPQITSSNSFTFFQFQHDLVGPTPNADTGGFADYDTLGVDNRALYIGVNMFNPSFAGTTGFVVNKAALLTNALIVTAFRQLGTSTSGMYTPQGVHNDDPNSTEGYFVGVDAGTLGRLVLRRVSNPGGTPSVSGNINLTVPTTTNPINPKPLGSTKPLDALDDRLFAARMHNGHLWTAHNIQVDSTGVASSSGGRDGARWYEIISLTSSPSVNQSGTLFDPAASGASSYWIPSCAMSGQGHMALGSSVGGANEHAELAVAGRFAADGLGTIQTATVAQTSSTSYNLNDRSNPHRWGDYSVVTVDPNDDMTMWTFQEYCNANNSWAVRVIQLKAPPPAAPVAASPSVLTQGVASANVVIRGLSSNGAGFFDPDPSFSNHIAAVVNGGSVTVNSVTFNNPTNITLNLTVAALAATGARTVTVTNPDGQSATSGSGILTIVAGATNSLPVINAASVSPSSPCTTNDLLANVTSSFDADGDPITFAYQWQESTTNLTAQTASNLLAAATFAGGSYRCIITPNDGRGNGAPFITAPVLVPVDCDGNGLNDDWEVQNFGHIGVDQNADPDGDSFSNLQEFAAGTDPNDAASALRITSITQSGDDFVISFTTVLNKMYEVRRADDLTSGLWSVVTNGVNGTGAIVQVTDLGAAGAAERFYRVTLLP